MGTGSNGQGSGGGHGGKGGNPQGNKPSRSGAQNTTTRKVSFLHGLQRRTRAGENAEVHRERLRFNAITDRRSATVMTETREAATMMHARGVKRTRKAQERSRQNGTVSVPSRSWNGWRRCRYWNAKRPAVRRRLAAAS